MQHKRKELAISVFLLGVALIVLAFVFFRTQTPNAGFELIARFAFALLVAVVIRMTWIFVYREDKDFDEFRALGMMKAQRRLKDDDLQARLASSKSIRVLKTWFPETEEIKIGLGQAIKGQGATVELLLCKPGSILLRQRSLGAHKNEGSGSFKVYEAVEDVHRWLTETPGIEAKNVQIAIYDSWPGCPVIWYDKKILMGFYFRRAPSPAWPWITVETGSTLATILKDQFDDLWKHSDTRHLDSPEEMEKWLEENKRWRMDEAEDDSG